MSDPDKRRAYDEGYSAFMEGQPSMIVPERWRHNSRANDWHRGYQTAEADAQRNTLQTEGEMPEEQIMWLRNNLKLEIERSSGLVRVYLRLGDEVVSSIDIDLQEPSV